MIRGSRYEPELVDARGRINFQNRTSWYIIGFVISDFIRKYLWNLPFFATIATAVLVLILWFIMYYSIEFIAM